MLLSLSIKNYLLIDSIDLNFNKGFSVITGETGAGKSIIIGALSLLLGKRADSVIAPDKEAKSVIEASFDISKSGLEIFFENLELDFDNITIIRREILTNGKSRAFINDTPVNLSTLKLVSEKLIDLHSQHENLALSMADYRMQIIDSVAETTNLYNEYIELYNSLNVIRQQLSKANSELEKSRRDIDYYKFQVEQIESAQLGEDNEMEELEIQSSLLENAEEIKNNILYSLSILDNDESSVENLLREVRSSLSKINRIYKPADDIIARIDSLIIEIRDINGSLSQDIEKAESNPELLQKINSRIDLMNNLFLKHNVKDISELKLKYKEYNNKILTTEEIEEKITELKQKELQIYNEALSVAKDLSELRKSSFSKIEQHISGLLKDLGIIHGVFKIKNEILSEISISGFDNISFLFSANKSIEPQLLEKVASGGEFSRLMLALKSLIVETSGVSTIIFDEIDTGVSGEIASKMGKIISKISDKIQVISITHLPQVAAMGKAHYKVYKDVSGERSITKVKKLQDKERINEIAAMISGEVLTPQAIENAKTLLSL